MRSRPEIGDDVSPLPKRDNNALIKLKLDFHNGEYLSESFWTKYNKSYSPLQLL